MKNTITEVKNTLEGTNSRLSEAEEQRSEPGDRMVEITEAEENKEKLKRNEDSLRDLWDKPRHMLSQTFLPLKHISKLHHALPSGVSSV